MRWLRNIGQFLGRMLLSIIFIVAGAGKIFDFNGTMQQMISQGLTQFTPLLLVGVMIIELVGGFFLLIGYKARWMAMLLFLFLIPTTYIFHDFWNAAEQDKTLQAILFFKNLAIMGGLLFLASTSSGAISLDSKSEHTKQNQL